MDAIFWLIMPIFILWGINELRKPDAEKQLREIQQKKAAEKTAFEDEWQKKSASIGKELLISNLQEEISSVRNKINSMCYDEGGIIYDPHDPYSYDDDDGYYKKKYDAYVKRIDQINNAINYIRTLA